MGGWDKAPEYGGGGGRWPTILAVIAAALFSAAMAWLYFASAAAKTTTVAGVASVNDGDTIEIHSQRIRLSRHRTGSAATFWAFAIRLTEPARWRRLKAFIVRHGVDHEQFAIAAFVGGDGHVTAVGDDLDVVAAAVRV